MNKIALNMKSIPKFMYYPIGALFLMLFFMFYSFNVDENKVIDGYRSIATKYTPDISVTSIAAQIEAIREQEESEYVAMDDVVPSQVISAEYGGMGIPLFYQWDSRWGADEYGYGTMAGKACGPTALAMVVSYLTGKAVYPNDIVDKIGNKYYVSGSGTDWTMFEEVAPDYGCKATKYAKINAEGIVNALKENKPVIVSASGYGTTQAFTGGGHFMVLRGLTKDGKILVNDPNDKDTKRHYAREYDPEFIVSECTKWGTPKPYWVCEKEK